MNTWIWGPPKWKFLHSLSFSPHAPLYSSEVSQFLNTLTFVLPCIYCRESYSGFVTALIETWGKSVSQVVADGQLALWMYQLHDKVNDKLDTQLTKAQLEESGVTLPGMTLSQEKAMCRKRQITFDCLRKRFVLRPVQFCTEDVWEFLCIFAMNMDTTKKQASPEQMQHWQQFFKLIPRMVKVAGGSKSLAATLQQHKQFIMSAVMLEGDSVFPAVLVAKAQHEEQVFDKDFIDYHTHMFQYARAHTCAHGSCK